MVNNFDIRTCNTIARNINFGYLEIEDIPQNLSDEEKKLIIDLVNLNKIFKSSYTFDFNTRVQLFCQNLKAN